MPFSIPQEPLLKHWMKFAVELLFLCQEQEHLAEAFYSLDAIRTQNKQGEFENSLIPVDKLEQAIIHASERMVDEHAPASGYSVSKRYMAQHTKQLELLNIREHFFAAIQDNTHYHLMVFEAICFHVRSQVYQFKQPGHDDKETILEFFIEQQDVHECDFKQFSLELIDKLLAHYFSKIYLPHILGSFDGLNQEEFHQEHLQLLKDMESELQETIHIYKKIEEAEHESNFSEEIKQQPSISFGFFNLQFIEPKFMSLNIANKP